MKIWTYEEMVTKVKTDLDMLDETFISPNEMAGYFNEALTEAESEILGIKEDYFKTLYYMPLQVGTSLYDLPFNIFANKVRGLIYRNGSEIYEVPRYRRVNKFGNIAMTEQFGSADDYQYDLINDIPGQAQLELHPTSRDAGTLTSGVYSSPMWLYYIRNCARVPLIAANGVDADWCNPELMLPSQVDTTNDRITFNAGTSPASTPCILQKWQVGRPPGSITYVTGDAVRFRLGTPGSALPGGLSEYTTYYIYINPAAPTYIKFADTLAHAIQGSTINLTTTGTGNFIMEVAATVNIQNATLIDIPEFATFIMQWVKCRCGEKQGHPLLDNMAATLVEQKAQMVSTLTESVEDDNTEIQGDFSHYREMS